MGRLMDLGLDHTSFAFGLVLGALASPVFIWAVRRLKATAYGKDR